MPKYNVPCYFDINYLNCWLPIEGSTPLDAINRFVDMSPQQRLDYFIDYYKHDEEFMALLLHNATITFNDCYTADELEEE